MLSVFFITQTLIIVSPRGQQYKPLHVTGYNSKISDQQLLSLHLLIISMVLTNQGNEKQDILCY